ncbi:MAG TPA: site-specific integrase [Opitutaceae bacterium]
MSETKFAVSRFQNRNGVTSWRVSGWLHGVRIRKNFLTKEEAAAEKATLEIKAVQVSAGFRPAMTLLTDAQLRDAEASWHRLQGKPQPLSFYVDYALANYRPPEHQKPLAAAVAVYLAERTKAFEQDMLSPRQLRSIRNELEALQAHFPKATVCQFTAPILRAYLERGDSVLKTYNNRRGVLSTFFKFAFQHDWIASNPVERTPHHRINHRRGSAVTITAEKARELMAYVETFRDAALVTYFAICLFAGIRPCIRGGEIKKLKAESVRLDTGVIHIEPEVSKVRMKRNVTIQSNLAAWLRAYPLAEFPIVPPNSMNTRKEVFDKFALTHDVLRHTFISMFVAKFRSMGEAALQAGNSEAIIRKHYLDLKNPAEAEEYFSILPNRRAAPAAATAEIVSIHSPSTLRAAM